MDNPEEPAPAHLAAVAPRGPSLPARVRAMLRGEGAGDRRERRALWTTLTAVGGRGVSMVLSLASVPLTVKYLDPERFGLWVTMGSTLSWLSMADLGLGNGLTNAVTKAAAAGDLADERQAISTSFILVTRVSLLMAVIFTPLFLVVPWDKVFAVSAAISHGELWTSVACMAGIFFLSFPLGLIDKIYAGHQEGYVSNYWAIGNNVLTVIALLLVCQFGKGLPWLIVALSGGALAVRAASTLYLFLVRRPEIRPRWSAYDAARGKGLLRTGAAFLVVQLAAAGMWQNDNIIVAQLHGEAAVAPYAMSFRLGAFHVGLLSMWLSPLWPAYADAGSRRDYAWIRRSVQRTVRLGMGVTALASVGVVLFGQRIIRVWTGSDAIVPSRALLLAIGAYMLIMCWCLAHTMPLNGLGRLRGQMYYGIFAAILNIGLSIILGRRLGPSGVCWATCIAALLPAIGTRIELHRALRELDTAHAEPAPA